MNFYRQARIAKLEKRRAAKTLAFYTVETAPCGEMIISGVMRLADRKQLERLPDEPLEELRQRACDHFGHKLDFEIAQKALYFLSAIEAWTSGAQLVFL